MSKGLFWSPKKKKTEKKHLVVYTNEEDFVDGRQETDPLSPFEKKGLNP